MGTAAVMRVTADDRVEVYCLEARGGLSGFGELLLTGFMTEQRANELWAEWGKHPTNQRGLYTSLLAAESSCADVIWKYIWCEAINGWMFKPGNATRWIPLSRKTLEAWTSRDVDTEWVDFCKEWPTWTLRDMRDVRPETKNSEGDTQVEPQCAEDELRREMEVIIAQARHELGEMDQKSADALARMHSTDEQIERLEYQRAAEERTFDECNQRAGVLRHRIRVLDRIAKYLPGESKPEQQLCKACGGPMEGTYKPVCPPCMDKAEHTAAKRFVEPQEDECADLGFCAEQEAALTLLGFKQEDVDRWYKGHVAEGLITVSLYDGDNREDQLVTLRVIVPLGDHPEFEVVQVSEPSAHQAFYQAQYELERKRAMLHRMTDVIQDANHVLLERKR